MEKILTKDEVLKWSLQDAAKALNEMAQLCGHGNCKSCPFDKAEPGCGEMANFTIQKLSKDILEWTIEEA